MRQLKNDSTVKAIRQLEDALATLPAGATAATVQTAVNYFHEHQARMDDRAGGRRGEPRGSGPIKAPCRQYQRRFKRPGQFWSRTCDEALLCLETLSRNGGWPSSPAFRPYNELRGALHRPCAAAQPFLP